MTAKGGVYLQLGSSAIEVLFIDSPVRASSGGVADNFKVSSVMVSRTVKLPAHSVLLLHGKMKGDFGGPVWCGEEGLVEGGESVGNPNYILVARSLSRVNDQGEVSIQVMNVGPMEVTLHKGTTIANFVPRRNVFLLEDVEGHAQRGGASEKLRKGSLLKVDLQGSELTTKEMKELRGLLEEYSELFSDGELGRTSKVKHGISTSGPPIRQPIRRQPVALRKTVQEEVHKMLKNKVILPSTSPWSSPIIMVRKKDGSWRFCIDFRKLNSVTHKDAYPLPRIDETLESLAGSTIFSTLDLASGYWQVGLEENDKEKTAFSTMEGHFEFNVMPFGLTNAPSSFQRLMTCVLSGLTNDQCLIYIDDIIVFSATFSEHLDRLRNVFQRVQDAGLRLKANKCHFAQSKVSYLGHIVSKKGVEPDPSKIQAVLHYPAPNNVKELRQFLGLANYYRRFVQGYSRIASPLFKLTNKTDLKTFSWTAQCTMAFQELKERLTTPPVLAFPQFDREFLLATDASDSAIGAVLSQVDDNGTEKVIAYWSRQLTKAERNYSTIEREALAIVKAVKEFYPYLYGHDFILQTDHQPLVHMNNLRDVGGRVTRWSMFLQQFRFTVRHKAGKLNGNADGLSRTPSIQLAAAISQVESSDNFAKIKEAQAKDAYMVLVYEAVKDGKPPPGLTHQNGKIFIHKGVLCRRFKESGDSEVCIQMLIPLEMRSTILEHLHNRAGHMGVKRTLERVRHRFYWPGYESDVERWVRECETCQKRNNPQPCPQAPLDTISASHPFQKITWDIMGPLPVTRKGNKYILVVTDVFSKWVEAFPLQVTDGLTLTSILMDEVICRYGVPQQLHSDQGSNLNAEVNQRLCQLLGIERSRTTAYHPEGNGQVERFNRTVEAILAKMVGEHQDDWDKHLQKAVFAYRTSLHESTGYSPYFVNFGRSPVLPVDVMLGRFGTGERGDGTIPQYIKEVKTTLKMAYDVIRENLDVAQKKRKERRDKHCAEVNFKVGDRVWLFNPAVKVGETRKLSSQWRGPYTVIDRVSPVNYKIQLIGTTKTQTVHHNRMKMCHGDPEKWNSEQSNEDDPAVLPDDASFDLGFDCGGVERSIGGYVGADDEIPQQPVHLHRSQRDRHPPLRYGQYYTH